jgi:hypothetical protein
MIQSGGGQTALLWNHSSKTQPGLAGQLDGRFIWDFFQAKFYVEQSFFLPKQSRFRDLKHKIKLGLTNQHAGQPIHPVRWASNQVELEICLKQKLVDRSCYCNFLLS